MWAFFLSNWGFYHHVCSSLCLSNSQIPSQIHCCPPPSSPISVLFSDALSAFLSVLPSKAHGYIYFLFPLPCPFPISCSLCPGQSRLRCLSCAIWIIALNNNTTSCLQGYFLHLENMISEYLTLSPSARTLSVKIYLLVCGHL